MKENYNSHHSENTPQSETSRYSTINNPQPQTIFLMQEDTKSNGMGIAGFILSLIALFVGWIPFIGWLVWLLGLIFSFVGIFKAPKGFAIAGLVISLIGIILLIFVFGAILAIASLSA